MKYIIISYVIISEQTRIVFGNMGMIADLVPSEEKLIEMVKDQVQRPDPVVTIMSVSTLSREDYVNFYNLH